MVCAPLRAAPGRLTASQRRTSLVSEGDCHQPLLQAGTRPRPRSEHEPALQQLASLGQQLHTRGKAVAIHSQDLARGHNLPITAQPGGAADPRAARASGAANPVSTATSRPGGQGPVITAPATTALPRPPARQVRPALRCAAAGAGRTPGYSSEPPAHIGHYRFRADQTSRLTCFPP